MKIRFFIISILLFVPSCTSQQSTGDSFREQAQMAESIESVEVRTQSLTRSLRMCADELDSVHAGYKKEIKQIKSDYEQRLKVLRDALESKDERIQDLSDTCIDEAGTTSDLIKWGMVGMVGIGILIVIALAIYAYIKRGLPGPL